MKNKKKAYTLTEILVVIVIVASLSAVVIPQYKNMVETRKAGEAEAVLTAVRTEQERRCAIGKEYVSIEKLADLVPEKSTKNFNYESGDQNLIANTQQGSKYSYSLKVGTYRDGRICCEGDDCDKFNYLRCSEFEPVKAPECASPEAVGSVGKPADPCDGVTVPPADYDAEKQACEAGLTGNKTRTKIISYKCDAGEVKSSVSYSDWDSSECKDPCDGVSVPDSESGNETEECDFGFTGTKTRTKTTSYRCEAGEVKSNITYGEWDKSQCKDKCEGVKVPDSQSEEESEECGFGYTGTKKRTKTISYRCVNGEITSSTSYSSWDRSQCKDKCEGVTVPEKQTGEETANCDGDFLGQKSRTKTTTYTCVDGDVTSTDTYGGWDSSKCYKAGNFEDKDYKASCPSDYSRGSAYRIRTCKKQYGNGSYDDCSEWVAHYEQCYASSVKETRTPACPDICSKGAATSSRTCKQYANTTGDGVGESDCGDWKDDFSGCYTDVEDSCSVKCPGACPSGSATGVKACKQYCYASGTSLKLSKSCDSCQASDYSGCYVSTTESCSGSCKDACPSGHSTGKMTVKQFCSAGTAGTLSDKKEFGTCGNLDYSGCYKTGVKVETACKCSADGGEYSSGLASGKKFYTYTRHCTKTGLSTGDTSDRFPASGYDTSSCNLGSCYKTCTVVEEKECGTGYVGFQKRTCSKASCYLSGAESTTICGGSWDNSGCKKIDTSKPTKTCSWSISCNEYWGREPSSMFAYTPSSMFTASKGGYPADEPCPAEKPVGVTWKDNCVKCQTYESSVPCSEISSVYHLGTFARNTDICGNNNWTNGESVLCYYETTCEGYVDNTGKVYKAGGALRHYMNGYIDPVHCDDFNS